MGRISKPQRSNKHKKIKTVDEEYSKLYGDNKASHKKGQRPGKLVNQRPKDLDSQDMPRSFHDLMRGMEEGKIKKKRKKKKKNVPQVDTSMTRPMRTVPKFKQRTGESERAFMHRMDTEAQAVVAKTQFEDKYKVKLGESGDAESVVKKKKGKLKKEKERLKEKKTKKKQMKNEKHENKKSGFEELKDDVHFGEVAMAPPTLTAKPRKSETAMAKPGKRSLLLKEIIQQNEIHSQGQQSGNRELGQSTKRKHLSMARQSVIDAERQRVIDMYRDMKLQKMKTR